MVFGSTWNHVRRRTPCDFKDIRHGGALSPFASPSRRPSPYVEGLTRRRGGRGELPFAEPEPRSEVPRFNLCARDSTLNQKNSPKQQFPAGLQPRAQTLSAKGRKNGRRGNSKRLSGTANACQVPPRHFPLQELIELRRLDPLPLGVRKL